VPSVAPPWCDSTDFPPDDFDQVHAVPEAEAFAMAREAAQMEGVFSGPSSGANLVALDIARRLGPGHRVVTVQVDSGLEYLAGGPYACRWPNGPLPMMPRRGPRAPRSAASGGT
jgi:Pyridoxal-phosphate dependent enzyme